MALDESTEKRLACFATLDEETKRLAAAIERTEKAMAFIISTLEPFESLIYKQYPKLEKRFESLKRVYGKEENEHRKSS